MGFAKRVLTLLLAALLVFPATNVSAANGSGTTRDITQTKVDKSKNSYYIKYTVKGWVFNGKFKYPKATVTLYETDANGKTTKTVLTQGKHWKFKTGQGTNSLGKHKVVGKHTTQIIGLGRFKGKYTVSYKVTKNTKTALKTKVSKKTYKFKALKKSKKTFKIGATASKFVPKSKIKYSTAKTKKSLRKFISVSKSGKVTLKKKAKKGTYIVTVSVKATRDYKGKSKTVKIVVK